MFRLLGWIAKKAFSFVSKPYKKGWKMWQAGKGMKPFGYMYPGEQGWMKKVTSTLTGDALKNPRTRLIYQAFMWSKTPPGMEFIQPLTRISYTQTYKSWRYRVKEIGIMSKWWHSPFNRKMAFLSVDKFNYKAANGKIIPLYSQVNLYKYLRSEYGMNFNIDRTIDKLTGRKWRKKMKKAVDILGDFSTKPNRQKRARSRQSGVTLDPYKGSLGAMKNVRQNASYAALENSYDTFGSNDLSEFYSMELNDKNFDFDGEVKDAMSQLGKPDNAAGTSFPKAPGTWLESALFSGGMMDISPKEGKTTIVPAGQELFKQMANSSQPGKLLWNGPWLYKRRFKKKER